MARPVQNILAIKAQQATYLLNKIRAANNKTSDDDVRLFEFCEHEKLDMLIVCQMLGLKE